MRPLTIALVLPLLLAPAFAAHAQAAATPAPAAAVDEAARPKVTSNSWNIEFKRSAKSAGTMAFRLWPYGKPPIVVSVDVKAGETGNSVALRIHDAFRDVLDSQRYAVDVKKDFVWIISGRGERRFGLEQVKPGVDGILIELNRG